MTTVCCCLNVPWAPTVVSGYVGNKCAVFPMQLLGFDVCPLNSVQFSNHTGYGKGKVAGDVMVDTQFAALIDMMETNGLLHFSHVLTGLFGGGVAVAVAVALKVLPVVSSVSAR